MKSLLIALGLAETAPEADALAAISRSRDNERAVCALTGQPTLAASIGVLTAWRESHAQLPAAQAELAKIHKATEESTALSLIEAATKDGRVPPAKKDATVALYRAHGKAALEAHLAALVPHVAAASATTTAAGDPAPAPATVTLSAEEREAARLCGLSEADLLKEKTRLTARTAA